MTRFHGVFAPNAAWRKLIVVESLGKLIEEKLGALAVGPVGPSLGLFVPKPARPKRELTEPLLNHLSSNWLLEGVSRFDLIFEANPELASVPTHGSIPDTITSPPTMPNPALEATKGAFTLGLPMQEKLVNPQFELREFETSRCEPCRRDRVQPCP